MKINAKTLFSDAQKEKIREAVKAAECSTRGKMVMLVDESDPYREAELARGILPFRPRRASFIRYTAPHLHLVLHPCNGRPFRAVPWCFSGGCRTSSLPSSPTRGSTKR